MLASVGSEVMSRVPPRSSVRAILQRAPASGTRRLSSCVRTSGVLHDSPMAFKGFDLTGRVAVVVGGTSGIGRPIAHGLADAGADVVPTSRRPEQVDAAAAEIEERGRRSLRVASDVADR